MRGKLLSLLVLFAALAACDNQKVTHPLNYNPVDGGDTGDTGDGGPSFGLRDAGPDAGGSGSTGTSGESGSTGLTGGSTGLTTGGSTGVSTGGSSGTSGTTGTVDAGPRDAGFVDHDGDGLDDTFEAQTARAYLPYLSLDPNEGCGLGGIVYRVSPHPADPTYLRIVYDHLYQHSCGALGGTTHVGDAEAFALTVDPSQPPPLGIVHVVAISHAGGCNHTSSCTTHTPSGACASSPSCDLGTVQGTQRAVVYSSLGGHGSFATLNDCSSGCFAQCAMASTPTVPQLINVGEPDGQLITDLTTQGFVSFPNGWTETSLEHYDPWGDAGFGAGPVVAQQLTDPSLDTLICP
ncbi:MAG: hypothetical protein JST54_26830 [Deltaproteobacteria bacterium]|nr:hypothetical protein [Deltaproteobacteria bacterium]